MARKHHALAVPVPAQGHINPMMRFCRKLAREGVLVTFVNIDPIHHRIEDQLLQLHDVEQAEQQQQPAINPMSSHQHEKLEIRRAHVPIEGFDLSQDFALSLKTAFEAQKSITPHLHQLLLQLNQSGDHPVTCLISDMFMTAPTQPLADSFNIPSIVLFPSCQTIHLFYHHLFTDPVISVERVLEVVTKETSLGDQEVFAKGLEGLPNLIRVRDLPHFCHVVDDNDYMFHFLEQEMLKSFEKAHSVVVNSFDELEGPAFQALSNRLKSIPIYGVGPLVEPLEGTNLWKEDEACMLWLDQQPSFSVLYVSFGSTTLLSYPQFKEIVDALLSSQQRFLWVLRPGLLGNASNNEKHSLDILSRTNGQGYIVDWSPQALVLAHPSVGGFLTHCGWNSTIEAIYHGVPMLCWPYFADQHFDTKLVEEEWKIGLRFNLNNRQGVIQRMEIERVIKAVMEGEEGRRLRQNVTKLKEASRQALSPKGTSYKNLQALLNSLNV